MKKKTVTQLAVFVENRAGRLAEVCDTLGHAGINIVGFSIADMRDYGIFRLVVAEPERAEEFLRDHGFTLRSREVICVNVPHRPGGLAEVLRLFSEAQINVEYLYAIANTLIVFNLDHPEQGIKVLEEKGIELKRIEEVGQ